MNTIGSDGTQAPKVKERDTKHTHVHEDGTVQSEQEQPNRDGDVREHDERHIQHRHHDDGLVHEHPDEADPGQKYEHDHPN